MVKLSMLTFFKILEDIVGLMTDIYAEREYIRDSKIIKMLVIELTNDRYVLIKMLECNVIWVVIFSCLFDCLFYFNGKCECVLFGDYVDEVKKKKG